jgi:hypothetical protein
MQETEQALIWITSILNKLNVPFQIAGGLAARIYGSTRELVDIDIDIPENQFDLVKQHVNPFIVFQPTQYKDEVWDLYLMTLNYQNQIIDLCGAYNTKIRNLKTGEWEQLITDFSKTEIKTLFGLDLPVIAQSDLLLYKKIAGREVDIIDIELICRSNQ